MRGERRKDEAPNLISVRPSLSSQIPPPDDEWKKGRPPALSLQRRRDVHPPNLGVSEEKFVPVPLRTNFFLFPLSLSRTDRGLHTSLLPDVLDHLVGRHPATEATPARHVQAIHGLRFYPCEGDR